MSTLSHGPEFPMLETLAMTKKISIPDNVINKIHQIRNHRVMLDIGLAELYQVETKRLNEQVKRNIDRFPEDFMFQLNNEEWELLRSQFATSKERRGGRRYAPLHLPSMAF